jgi:hypothetical protein
MERQPVAVHEIAGVSFPQKYVRKIRVIGDEKSESLAVGLKPPFDDLSFGGKAKVAPIKLHQPALFDQYPKRPA